MPAGADAAQAAAIAATTSTLGAVSAGDAANGQFRQITGVAAGTDDDDAVNVAQLTALADVVEGNEIHYFSVNDNGVIGGNYDNDGATGINALAAGVGAVASDNNAVAVGFGTVAGAINSVAVGSEATTEVRGSIVIGRNTSMTSVWGTGPITGGNYQVGGVVIGSRAEGYIDGSTVGSGAYSPVAIGNSSRAMADGAVALGGRAEPTGIPSNSVDGFCFKKKTKQDKTGTDTSIMQPHLTDVSRHTK
ncbi:hypothetical protein CSC62_17170, partial [Pseudoxanthomonas jiangsuensis]